MDRSVGTRHAPILHGPGAANVCRNYPLTLLIFALPARAVWFMCTNNHPLHVRGSDEMAVNGRSPFALSELYYGEISQTAGCWSGRPRKV